MTTTERQTAQHPIKTLIVIRGFAMDGPGCLLLNIISHWSPADIQIYLISLNSEGPLKAPYEAQVTRLNGQMIVRNVGWNGLNAFALEMANKESIKGTQLVLAHLLRPDKCARQLAKRLALPYLLIEHGLHSWSDKGAWMRPFISRWYRSTLRNDDRIIAVSGKVQRQLLDVGIPLQQIETIKNGVDLRRFRVPTESERLSARRHFEIADGPCLVLVTVGGLTKNKRHDVAIQTLAVLKLKCDRPARLIIVGSGPELENLRNLAATLQVAKEVLFIGQMAAPEQALHAADLLIHPSIQESFGLAVAEAVACGLPVLARFGSGLEEVLQGYTKARLVAADSPDIWSESTLDLMEQSTLQPQTLTIPSIEDTAARYLDLLHRTAS